MTASATNTPDAASNNTPTHKVSGNAGKQPYAFVGLGSNLNANRNLCYALWLMRERIGRLVESPVYESAAVGFEGPAFWNMVVGFASPYGINELQAKLNQIEDDCGRDRSAERWSSRTLDLDLLLYGDEQINSERLTLPRDDITRYAFVLKPLVDLQPNTVMPGSKQSFAELWAEFDQAAQPLSTVLLDSALLELPADS